MSNDRPRLELIQGGQETIHSPERQQVKAELIGQLEVGYGTLGRETTEVEAHQVLDEVLTADPESTTGYAYLGMADENESATCGDGRRSKGALRGVFAKLRNKMLGGDLQVNWEADELTDGFQVKTIRRQEPQASPIQRAKGFLEKAMVRAYGRKGGGHISGVAHQHGPDCGCGAIDKHPDSMETIGRENQRAAESGKPNELVVLTTTAMTEPFDPMLHESISSKAARLAAEERETDYSGQAFIRMMTGTKADAPAIEPSESVEELAESHDEWLLIINYSNLTLKRDKFVTETGKQVFWIDEPAIKREAARYAIDERDARKRYQAMMTAQVAKGKTLACTGLRIAVVKPVEEHVPTAA